MTLRIQRRKAEPGAKAAGEQYTWDVTSTPKLGATKAIAGIPWTPGVEFPRESEYVFIRVLCCMASKKRNCLPEAGAIASNPATSRKRFQELLELVCLLGFNKQMLVTTKPSRRPERLAQKRSCHRTVWKETNCWLLE